jgi:hypothetical protein
VASEASAPRAARAPDDEPLAQAARASGGERSEPTEAIAAADFAGGARAQASASASASGPWRALTPAGSSFVSAPRSGARAQVSASASGAWRAVAPAGSSFVSAPRTEPADASEQLLRAAAAARAGGEFARASALYRRLEREFQGSAAAHAAQVSYARLLCTHLSEPGAGLARYDAYLRDEPAGPLAQEALRGKARCLQSVGRKAAADETWRKLLRDWPASLYAPEARKALAP